MSDAAVKYGASPRKGGTPFSCHAPAAGVVTVAGAFNDRNPTATPMTLQADATLAATFCLPSGRHEYKFVVDGEWCRVPGCEPAYRGCPKCVPNPLGAMSRVVEVPAR